MEKIWLITGIFSGLGKTLTESCIEKGYFVIGPVRKPQQQKEFNEKYKGKAEALLLDVTKNGRNKKYINIF